ncbi:hypothetical protein [Shouchella clausii]|uniref:hypothetical protein n=1 Tax=Shouchella clausii TaxID=79880 RepID=UPI000BA57D2A|nr:hypothetical protein [Shouchella clausii]PAD18612.1 hypothetical protein CHH73_04970 [Shouchella clausii]
MDSYSFNKDYKYTYENLGVDTYTVIYGGPSSHDNSWHIWRTEQFTTLYKEDARGLYMGHNEATDYYTELEYPVKQGNKWAPTEINDPEAVSTITNVGLTVRTPAGEFMDVIEVTDAAGAKIYYAKDMGFIKTIVNGKVDRVLIQLTKTS